MIEDYPHDLKKKEISHYFAKDKCELIPLKNQPAVPVHTHNFDELVFILSGSAVHIIDKEEYPIIRGDVFVVQGNQKHGYKNEKNLNIINLTYQREYFETIKKDYAELPGFKAMFVHEPLYRKKNNFKLKLHLNSKQLLEISQLLNHLSNEQKNEWAGTYASKLHLFNLIIISVCKYFSEFDSPQPKALLKISAAIDYIEKNFDKHITNLALANVTDMSQSSFRNSFKRITGLAPIDYLIKYRIEKAVEMMNENENIQVTDVAFSTGFDNSAYFTRKFKAVVGMTPKKYLKMRASFND